MNTIEQFQTISQTRKTSTEEGLKLFDQLEPVNLEFMMGRWQGYGIHTNHPMDGLLEAFAWYGKDFIDADQVHPLLFLDHQNQVISIKPSPMILKIGAVLNYPKPKFSKILFRLTSPFFKTETSHARLRMMEYRQKVTATMIYDNLPIHDSFGKIDNNTVLGVMDYKAIEKPFFFVLERRSG